MSIVRQEVIEAARRLTEGVTALHVGSVQDTEGHKARQGYVDRAYTALLNAANRAICDELNEDIRRRKDNGSIAT